MNGQTRPNKRKRSFAYCLPKYPLFPNSSERNCPFKGSNRAVQKRNGYEKAERTRSKSRGTRKSHSHTKSQIGTQVYRRRNASVLRSGAETRTADADNAPVKQITLYDHKMIITYNSPVSAGPDESRDFFFYRRTVEMPYVRQNKKETQYREFTVLFVV